MGPIIVMEIAPGDIPLVAHQRNVKSARIQAFASVDATWRVQEIVIIIALLDMVSITQQ